MVTVTKTNSAGELETDVVSSTSDIPAQPTAAEAAGSENDDSGGGLSGGAIAGIVIGVLALLLLLAAAWFWRRRKQKQQYALAHPDQPPPMDANDEKFFGLADPTSPTSASPSASTTPATIFGKLGMSSRADTPSTQGRSSVGAGRHSYVSSMSGGSPPPGAMAFTRPDQEIAQLDSSPVIVAEMDGAAAAARPPSELPATPVGNSPRGLGVQRAGERTSGGLPTVAENEADPRATLNPAGGEPGREYVTSWSSYEDASRAQGGQSLQGSQGAQGANAAP